GLCEKAENINREASLLADRTATAAPLASTISIWASDPKDEKQKLFEGLISGEAASKINESRIIDFATSRYIKLFEKVTRAE
ncbi:MAG: hypothetical protein ACK4N5_13290, partial [Myxococcales bacterium]